MSQNEQGMVYAFRLSGSRMRQGALQLRRQGQTLDALTLVRRAAEQEDTPSAWLALAAELRQTGNWEAAVQLLARVLSRAPRHHGAWIDMGRCMQALGQKDVAIDCAYHQLQEDPWSPEGNAARAMLAELEEGADPREPRRTQRLIHRGLTAWQSGNRAEGERCIRRALRMTADKNRLLVTTAMLCMLDMDFDAALHCLVRALRYSPEDPRTLTALSTLFHQQGKRRLALGFLQKAGKHTDSVMAEDGFLTTAWAQDAWTDLSAYLEERMKRQPYRIPLLSARATMHMELGDMEAALQLWKDIIAIDPDNRHAVTMIAAAQSQPEGFFAAPGMLPRSERIRQMTELKMAAESLPRAELLRPGSRSRRLLDWFTASSDGAERQYVMNLLGGSGEEDAVIPYLKELLCWPFLRHDMRQWALVRLAELGCREEMLILAGSHYTLIACQPVDEKKQQPWNRFLPALLKETRRYRQSGTIAAFAADLWRCMSPEQRRDAADRGRFAWCKAMEILYLRMAGEEERAAAVARGTPLSARKLSRVLRRLGRQFEAFPVTD